MAYDPTEYAREQAAKQKRLDELTGFVKVELQKLGHDVTLDVAESEGNPDARFLKFAGFNIRASFIEYGAGKGRVDWQGYAHKREFHTSDIPRLGDTTSAPDAAAARIAKQLVARIIEPAAEPVAKYNRIADEWDASRAAVPVQAAKVAALGFNPQFKPGDTEAAFYITREGVSGSARVNSSGSVYFDRLSLDSETGAAVLALLASRKVTRT